MDNGSRRVMTGLCSIFLLLTAGCHTYEVWQADHWQDASHQPERTKRAAVVMFAPWSEVGGEKIETHGTSQTLAKNVTFAEALIISLQQRGVRIVEQQVVQAAEREARLVLSKDADMVSTKELAQRLGQQLNLDTVFYADAINRSTRFEFSGKLFGASDDEALIRQREANERGTIVPDDARLCKITVHHSVGLTLRAVDIATGKITWVGYRYMAIAEDYDSDHPDVLTAFTAVQRLSDRIVADVTGKATDPSRL